MQRHSEKKQRREGIPNAHRRQHEEDMTKKARLGRQTCRTSRRNESSRLQGLRSTWRGPLEAHRGEKSTTESRVHPGAIGRYSTTERGDQQLKREIIGVPLGGNRPLNGGIHWTTPVGGGTQVRGFLRMRSQGTLKPGSCFDGQVSAKTIS